MSRSNEPIGIEEDDVDRMHGQVLDELRRHVALVAETHRRLVTRYEAVGSASVRGFDGTDRYKHVGRAILDLQAMLAGLSFSGLSSAHALMVIVDATCDKWEREAAGGQPPQ